MTLNGTPINTNSREYIELMKELENDAEILDAHHQSEVASSIPTPPASPPPTLDALLAPEEIGLPGVPYAERPERADEQAEVSFLMVRQAV